MARFVGLDPSFTNTGVCIIDGMKVETFSIKTSAKESVFARQKKACVEVCKLLSRDDLIAIEDFGISARYAPSGRFVERIEMCGMLKLLMGAKTQVPWFSCAPDILKMFIAGKGSAKKAEMVESVRYVWDQDVKNDDEADAFALARLCQAAVTSEDFQGKRRQAVDKFIVHGVNPQGLKLVSFLGLDQNFGPLMPAPVVCNQLHKAI